MNTEARRPIRAVGHDGLKHAVRGAVIAALLGTAPVAAVRADETAASGGLEEVVVTARRRAEASQNVPISVASFDAGALEARSVTMVSDLQRLIAGLHYQERGNLQTELTIRGVGGDARNPGVDSGVGMYVDGAYIPRTSGFNSDLTDVERIEVLRGPQGTLFGKNTIGGVINIVTAAPADAFAANAAVSIGNYGAVRARATVSGPVSDTVGGTLALASWNRDGYIRNPVRNERLNNEQRVGGRGQLRFQPSDAIDVRLSIDATRDRRRGVLNQIGSPAGAAAPYYTGNRFVVAADQRNLDERDMWGATLGIDYTLPNGATLTSITAFRDIDILVYSDVDQTPLDLFHSGPFTDDTRMVSQELRLASRSDAATRYVAGVFLYKQTVESFRDVFINGARAIVLDTSAETKSYAAFASVDHDFTSKLTATVGARYGTDEKDGRLVQTRTGLNYNMTLDRSDSNASWNASLLYKFSPNVSGYGTVSRGFKAGGFNLDPPAAAGLAPAALNFLPESVTNYEVGVKGRLGRALRFDASAFVMDYKDKQVSQFTTPPGSNFPVILVTNAGQAKIKGAELEVQWAITDALQLALNSSYLDATYTAFPNAARVGGVLVSYTGNRIERTPEWTGAVALQYRHPLRLGEIVADVGGAYVGNAFLQPDNLPRNYAGGYVMYDARLGFETSGGRIGVFAWGKNLAQKEYATFKRQFAGLDQVVFGEPRTYGLDVRWRFAN